MSANRRQHAVWVWCVGAAGLAGGALVALAAPAALADPAVSWWYGTPWPGGRGLNTALVYAGMAVLAAAWLGLGGLLGTRRRGGPGRPGAREVSAPVRSRAQGVPAPVRLGARGVSAPVPVVALSAAWAVPLLLAPPLFSRDLYSYLAQGTLLHLGLDPYRATPMALAVHGHAHLLQAVSPFWRHTTAPYGPLFLGLASLIAGATGSHLVAGVLAVRGLELVGAILLAVYLPRLARALGGDPARTLWLGLASPLVLLGLLAAGHNDLLMAGLLAAGAAVALEGRPLTGVAVCALAATVKLPALAAVAFIVVAWVRAETDPRERARFAAAAGGILVCVLAFVSLVTGAGIGWLTSTVFSTPARVRLAITPATGLGWTAAALLRDAGAVVSARAAEGALGLVAAGLTAVAGVVLLARVRVGRLAGALALFLALAAAGGPAAWPWYFVWALVLAAALPRVQASAAPAAALVVGAFLVRPDGILALPIQASPAVVVVYGALAALAAVTWRRRRRVARARAGASAELPDHTGVGPGASAALPDRAAPLLLPRA